jgi:hypothetical protein
MFRPETQEVDKKLKNTPCGVFLTVRVKSVLLLFVVFQTKTKPRGVDPEYLEGWAL